MSFPSHSPPGAPSSLLLRWGRATLGALGARHRASRRSEDRFRSLASSSPLGVFSLSADGACEYANEQLCELTGRTDLELRGTGLTEAFHPDDREALRKAVTRAGGAAAALRLRLQLRDGSLRWVKTHAAPLRDGDTITGWVGSVEDVTAEVRAQIASSRIAAELAHKARHDHLTGLSNRTFFTEQIAELLADAELGVSVLFIDIDRFKVVNDSLGHGAGDRLLQQFAERLRGAVRAGDLTARFGADEFVVGLVGVRDPDAAATEAQRLLAALTTTMLVDEHEVMVTVSIGTAVEHQGVDAETMVAHADAAMYRAKARGKGRIEAYRPEPAPTTGDSTLEQERQLRLAIETEQLRLVYQPILAVRSRAIVGVEALVRWKHPERGLLPPAAFIPLAEESGLIVALGTWVLRTACAQLRRWQPTLHAGPTFTMSVNVSAQQLADPFFLTVVAEALRDYEVNPASLCLEITETSLLQDLESVDEVLRSLRAIGLRIAVDDFGTGYSSLSHLKLLPIDVIKIDRSFVSELGIDSDDTAIVGAVIRLAGSLGLISVAEGVEEIDQLNWLGSLGCDMAQGYFLSRPESAEAVESLLRGPRLVPQLSDPAVQSDLTITHRAITPNGN